MRGAEAGSGWGRGGRRLPLIAALCLALAGCVTMGPATQGPRPQPKINKEIAAPSTPQEREHLRILAAYGGAYEAPQLETLANAIAARLSAASDRPDLQYRVTILNSASVNAFALPTGELYVTRGLLALANDTSEIASVLSHEIAHVLAQHAATREDQARQAAIVSRVVSDVLNDPQTGALALAKSKIALASFSRAQEFEADEIGVKLSARAGFDPYGAARFLSAMSRNAERRAPRSREFLSSHPSTPDRVRNAQLAARQLSAPIGAERDRASYLPLLEGLTFGEDPGEGFVRGNRFLHPKLGFTFTAPSGFTLENTPQAVLGVNGDGTEALRLDVVRVPGEQTLTDYLGSGWIDGIEEGSIRDETINGFPAATAMARGKEWAFKVTVLRFGSDAYRFIFASKRNSPDAYRAAANVVQSFRRLSLSEIESARPMRLKVVRVGPFDTAEKLAAQMTGVDQPLERFAVLNGLASGQSPKVGDYVKLIVE